jgi:putative pyruvate formate lyase activating enzyme
MIGTRIKATIRASYRDRLTRDELKERANHLESLLDPCVVCPRACHARRKHGEYGVCRSTDDVIVSSAGPHFGEEPPLVGLKGSGTIFFCSCNLKCLFCQNYEISHLRHGRVVSRLQLAELMLSLQRAGCHNINLVTPTHVTPQIIEALVLARDDGLSIPLVYNCGGYESVQTLSLLKDIVDIYMPDVKYSDNEHARRYSGVKDYWEFVRAAVLEMQRQVGCLEVDAEGIAIRGLLIRHLVLPNGIAGSKRVMEFIAREVSKDSYVNIMDQYRPAYRASAHRELNRSLTSHEYLEVTNYASMMGLARGFEPAFALQHP